MNTSPVMAAEDGNDVSSETLFGLLPNSTTAFDVTYTSGNESYNEFYDAVYAA